MASPSKRPNMQREQRNAIAGRKRRIAIQNDQAAKADVQHWPKPSKRPR